MVVRESTSNPPDRESSRKDKRNRVEISDPRLPVLPALTRGEEEKRRGNSAEQASE
jgi:hypothetical protein